MNRSSKAKLCIAVCIALGVSFTIVPFVRAQQPAAAATQPRQPAAKAADTYIPEIDKIRTPQSPAFVILGIAPTTIERPSTPSKMALSFTNGFAKKGQLLIPDNYAFEVAPYWLKSHPRLRASMLDDEFGDSSASGSKRAARLLRTIAQTLVVGVASTDSSFKTQINGLSVDTSVYRLGASVGASLIRGHRSPGCVQKIQSSLVGKAQVRAHAIAQYLVDHPGAQAAEIEREVQRLVAAAIADSFAERDPEGDCFKAYYGWTLDVAGAGVGRFDNQAFDKGNLSAHAWWATLGYKGESSRSALFVARIGKEGNAQKRLGSTYRDFGLRIVIPADELAFSVEGVSRTISANKSNETFWRFAGGFDYKISKGVWINSSFGRDYQSERSRSLIALLGLKWNLGTEALATGGRQDRGNL